MHDPRIGRFFARDQFESKYPWNSPYAFSENRVIDAYELEGLESRIFHLSRETQKDGSYIKKVDMIQLKTPGPLGNGTAIILNREGEKYYMYGNSTANIKEFQEFYEGKHSKVYPSLEGGNPTAGVGHKLTDKETKSFPVGTKLSESQIDDWQTNDIGKHTKLVENNKATKSLTGFKKMALMDFSFNGLSNRLSEFSEEPNESFFLSYLRKDKKTEDYAGGTFKRRVAQLVLFKTGEMYNFDIKKDTKTEKTIQNLYNNNKK